ncbi:MAG: phosphoglucosamine mutase [Acidimicrobiia bacterium]|nr:MAG: phosphoglucosamine mutase [Acidimicrobiia bacterium]
MPLFGTDGVRGVANRDLTPELALAIGRAAGESVGIGPILVGRDTRRSGDMLSAAFQAGAHSVGIDTVDVGILPSGGIARLVAVSDATLGAVITASHNPAPDNGIKLLSRSGRKLSDEREAAIEERIDRGAPWTAPTGDAVGMAFPMPDAEERYLSLLREGFGFSLRNFSLVVDGAHGAAFKAGPDLFTQLGANVETIGTAPNGTNINEGCGATDTAALSKAVNGRLGLAFDGDADRLIAVDEAGRVANGDVVMAVIARHLHDKGALPNDTVVATVMSNLGFHKAMDEAGIRVITTKVGDRYVVEALHEHGAGLGGEQSGHVVFPDRAPVGDGLLTALALLEVMAATGKPLTELRSVMTEYPQVLRNVRVGESATLADSVRVWDEVAAVEQRLAGEGRVLVRASGTEPLIRVMVEAASRDEANELALHLCDVVREELA